MLNVIINMCRKKKKIWNEMKEMKKRKITHHCRYCLQRALLLPFKFCINSKVKELYFKVLHNICLTNLYPSRFWDIENNTFISLLYLFNIRFWTHLEGCILCKAKCNHKFKWKIQLIRNIKIWVLYEMWEKC